MVEFVVDARGDLPERRYQLTLAGGRVEITEQAQSEREPDAQVSGPVSAWVSALGPDGGTDELALRRPPRARGRRARGFRAGRRAPRSRCRLAETSYRLLASPRRRTSSRPPRRAGTRPAASGR